jgi:TIR domain/Trypsin-like peptidase domain
LSADFFISYTGADEAWAKWIAVQLEQAGYTTIIQDFDFRPGNDFVSGMQRAARTADRTIAVLSSSYSDSQFGEAEWRVTFANDPTGERGLLVPVRVEAVDPPGLLRTRIFIDLVGVTESDARQLLLNGVGPQPSRPTTAPFPGETTASNSFEGASTRSSARGDTSPQFPGEIGAGKSQSPAWLNSLALIVDDNDNARGIALAIGPDVAITCNHVLRAAGRKATIRHRQHQEPLEQLEIEVDSRLDLALIRLESATLQPYFLPFTGSNPASRFVYLPEYADSSVSADATIQFERLRIGEIAKPSQSQDDSNELAVLTSTEIPVQMSGAPVVDNESSSLIGFIHRPDGQVSRVIPLSTVVQRWPSLVRPSVLEYPTFDEIVGAYSEALARSRWTFTPSSLHCVVVTSETSLQENASEGLDTLAKNIFSTGAGPSVWESFCKATDGRMLVSQGMRRHINQSYSRSAVTLATFNILDALRNMRSLELASQLIIEADLALFDVTHFEPAMMLLLGIRAATRRGVTIVSHGNGWRLGEPLPRPFNLADLSLASHTPSTNKRGDDPVVADMASRIICGFDQLVQRPQYRDLPVYDAIRQLGSSPDARTIIPFEQELLVLCSYHDSYFTTWKNIRSRLQQALSDSDVIARVVRLQDLDDPQLVSLSLYDKIRRCAGCVADWTNSSASTFFELGVRVAVSPWGVIQIVSDSWVSHVLTGESESVATSGQQFASMLALLGPIRYQGESDSTIGSEVAAKLIELRNSPELQGGHGLRRVAAEALARVDEVVPDVVALLRAEADLLSHPDQARNNVPQALYYELPGVKADQEKGALERRIAAWLYLDQRLKAADLPSDSALRQAWVETGQLCAEGLFESVLDSDIELAVYISEKIE